MNRTPRTLVFGAFTCLLVFALAAQEASAQGRGQRGRDAQVETGVTLSVEASSQIREFYRSQPASGAESLPPGIRKNLARGKPLPPGIAKKVAPPGLQAGLGLPGGFELVEVGLDVLLVEAATRVVHDVLRDVIR